MGWKTTPWILAVAIAGCRAASPPPPPARACAPEPRLVPDPPPDAPAPAPCARAVLAGAEPTVLASMAHQTPHALAVAGDRVYWTDRGGGGLWRVATTGGEAVEVARALAEPREVAATARAIYVATNDGVVRVDAATGAARLLVPGEEGATFALGRTALFVAEDRGRIDRVDLASDRVTVIADGFPRPLDIAAHGDSAIVTTLPDHALWELPDGGGGPRFLATLPREANHVAVDDTQIYAVPWASGKIFAIPFAGGSATVVQPAAGEVDSLTASAGGVWWTNMQVGCVAGTRAGARGPVGLYRDQHRAMAITAADGQLYWIVWTLGGGPMAILRAPEPALAR